MNAQTAVDYRFLEVIDIAGKPVADARVDMIGSGANSSQKTDGNGTVKQIAFYSGDFNTSGFKVSKPGYLIYEGSRSPDDPGKYLYSRLLEAEIPQYDPKKIKIVLLKIPSDEAERKAVEVEQHRQELLVAIKHSDSSTVQKLLQAGVSANTTDVHGIPAILWAAASGEVETIKALLAAGADVRNKSRTGRKALLYYLLNVPEQNKVESELVQRLIKAGADVNASGKYGETVLSLAKRYRDTKIIKLLESAGAREPSSR
jgi:hypothetical protein